MAAWAIKGQGGERRVGREAGGWSPILQVKLYNPADEAMGLPPLAAVRRALDLHNASADWAKALIDNAAKPSGALVYGGGGRIPADQFDRLKEELERSFSGAGNAGRPMLLEGGLQWQALSLSPAEMDFQETRSAAAREIALALLWRAAGIGEASEAVFEDRAGLAWRQVRLAAPLGLARWARRGADVPDQWDSPDPARAVSFAVEADFGAGFGARVVTALSEAAWPEGVLAVRVAEIGTDGRIGEWLSIPAGSPYL